MERKLPNLPPTDTFKLDIGCANCKEPGGFTGIDIVDYGQEVVWDVRDGIPFPDNSACEIYTSHFLEHLTNKESIAFFKEVWRVLKPDGIFRSRLPHCRHPAVFYPDHESFWNEQRIESMCRNYCKWEIVDNYFWQFELLFKLKAKKDEKNPDI